MIRIAAVADVHFGTDSEGTLRPQLEHLHERADAFLISGDLTRHGDPEEAAVLAREIADLPVPVVAILGNHDHHCDKGNEIRDVMSSCGVVVLEEEATILRVGERSLGIAGSKGFGGGFLGACATEFGEPEMKAFVAYTRRLAEGLQRSLESLEADHKVAMLHYSPVEDTLRGERPEIYPFLGSYLLAEAVDNGGADIVFHGHAHCGTEKGFTPGGIRVRNVAQHVIRHAYNVYVLGSEDDGEDATEVEPSRSAV